MSAPTVLVAFASQHGSTASIAEVIAAELEAAGLMVDRRVASEVESLAPYGALVLGSGVFVRSRSSDGGGFLGRHARELEPQRTWLFCAGPIGRGTSRGADASAECSVMDVARSIGARGAAAFGYVDVEPPLDSFDPAPPVDLARVRAWARDIALDLGYGSGSLDVAS
jgi:menaquinone-dependent protoporphyrinogen oxidase